MDQGHVKILLQNPSLSMHFERQKNKQKDTVTDNCPSVLKKEMEKKSGKVTHSVSKPTWKQIKP